jgi:hypothetical protein
MFRSRAQAAQKGRVSLVDFVAAAVAADVPASAGTENEEASAGNAEPTV